MTRILIIDDSPIVFKMIKKAMELRGFEIVGHAENGLIGLEMYAQLKPDVITLDVTMPVMDGLEAAKRLFEMDANVKIIMLSAMGDEDLMQQAKDIGVRHFHSKPINADELSTLINSLV